MTHKKLVNIFYKHVCFGERETKLRKSQKQTYGNTQENWYMTNKRSQFNFFL